MSYTFGAGTGDDIQHASPASLGSDNSVGIVLGWWYPTTLTATRGYWSGGNTFGAEVDGTTSEIRMRADNTTDGQWVTSGAGIATNQWWFIAWLQAFENTTVPGDWRVWVGSIDRQPQEVTVTNPVVRSGNYATSTAFFAGNKGTQTLAFQGDIGWIALFNTNPPGLNAQIPTATNGVITNDEADVVWKRFVIPMWNGTWSITDQGYGGFGVGGSAISEVNLDTPCDVTTPDTFLPRVSLTATNFSPGGFAAINGVTRAQTRAPVQFTRPRGYCQVPRMPLNRSAA